MNMKEKGKHNKGSQEMNVLTKGFLWQLGIKKRGIRSWKMRPISQNSRNDGHLQPPLP
jgi:hypothetical protein